MAQPLLSAQVIFNRACELATPAERQAYLDQACAHNAELRRRIEALLETVGDKPSGKYEMSEATHEQWLDAGVARGWIGRLLADIVPGQGLDTGALPAPLVEGVGSRIGQYKLLQQIGEGGMGTVFLAEQHEPLRRRVALKVIKAGMDTAQVIARFEAERQVLALMDHPHIAKVLDAGTTPSGRPYFVMELVKGIPITRYCDEQRLALWQRLDLFVPVCKAIQHAHQKGIIHRDIKPSNVLVADCDGHPVPKVIDFGLAKAMGHKLTERTLFTGIGALIGTLEYMSPEQAEFHALDIDTRSDIYSLGVLLYELLTGTTPLTRQRLKDAALTEVLRLIREEEPPRPSTRLSETKDSLASVSARRRMEPAALIRMVRGEIDWIVMKALEKDRTRRYETAIGLARDIQRYLGDEPVEAGPPSTTYRLRKLMWRYRRSLATSAALLLLAMGFLRAVEHALRGLAMVAALMLLLVVGAVVGGVLALWALHEERLANQRLDEVTTQKERAEKAEALVQEQLAVVQQQKERAEKAEKEAKRNEAKARQEELKAKQSEADTKGVLDFFRNKVLSGGRPEGQHGGLGRNVTLHQAVDAAEPAIAKAFADRPLVEASIRDTLGTTYWYLGEAALAIRQYARALALRTAGLGTNHPDTLTSRSNLANAYLDAGRTGEAIRLHEQTLKQREAKLGPDHPSTLSSRHNLATAYQRAGRTADAVCLHEQTLKQSEAQLGPDHPDTLRSRNNLAAAYGSAGRTAEAVHLFELTLKQMETKLGADHPDTLTSRNNLAEAYRAAGRIAEAIRHFEQNLKQQETKLGPEHSNTLTSRNNLASAYLSVGRIDEAIRLFEQTIKQMETRFGPEHPTTLISRNNQANAYQRAGRTTEAIRLYEQILQQREATLGPEHPLTLQSRNKLAEAYDRAGEFAKSEPLYRTALDQTRKRFGTGDAHTAGQMAVLGFNLLHQHRCADAEPLLRDCLQIREAKQPDAWTTFNTQLLLGDALLAQKKYADAEPLLLQGYRGMKQREAKIPPQGKMRLTEAVERLVRLYEATGRKDQADQWRKELERCHKAGTRSADKR